MSDRDRLIELIHKADVNDSYECELCEKDDSACLLCQAAKIADYLLANGVKMLPIPIGTVVYEIRAKGIRRYNGRKYDYAISSKLMFENAIGYDAELYVKAKACTKTDILRMNKSVFLTEEDARQEIERWKK